MSKRINEVAEAELEARLKVREYDLSQEIIDQPELYYHAAREAAIADSERAMIEDEMKELKARLYSELREKLENEGGKVTEAQLANAITAHPKIVKKRKERLEASLEHARLEALKSAYYQRSFTLRDLASMKMREMDSTNAVKGNGEAVDYQIQETRKEAKKLRKDYSMPAKSADRKKIRRK